VSDARQGAYEILQRVEQGGYADLLLDGWLKRHPQIDPRERGLLTELVYGVLRLRGRLDFALSGFSRQPLEKLEPNALRLLRLGAYQLLVLDRVPARAAVHSTVELARQCGMERVSGLVNGVLRALSRGLADIAWPEPNTPRPYMERVCSLPGWIAKEIMRLLPNVEAVALAEALSKPAPLTLRVNTLQQTRDDFLSALATAGHEARPCVYAPEGVIVDKRGANPIPGDREGWYQVQDEASMLVSRLLDPRPGERILDACAAPGGKTTHIATLAESRATILALDLHEHRVELVRQGARRLGCAQIEARQGDLRTAPDFLEPESFDRILVDAPCSGLGVLRRNPESRWSRQPADVRQLAELQSTILGNVAPLLRPGGVLVYSLCTFTQRETEEVVRSFLATRKEFTREGLHSIVPPGWESLLTDAGELRSWTHRHDGMDAFYAVRLRKRD